MLQKWLSCIMPLPMSIGMHFPIHEDLRHTPELYFLGCVFVVVCCENVSSVLCRKAFSDPCRQFKTLRNVLFCFCMLRKWLVCVMPESSESIFRSMQTVVVLLLFFVRCKNVSFVLCQNPKHFQILADWRHPEFFCFVFCTLRKWLLYHA